MEVNQKKLEKYMDIIDCQRPNSQKHIKMDRMKRAAQFAPFAALTGYGAAIDKTKQMAEEKWKDEYE